MHKLFITLGLFTIILSACTKDHSTEQLCEHITIPDIKLLDSSSYSFISYAITDSIVFKNNTGDSIVFSPKSFYIGNLSVTNVNVPCEIGGDSVNVTTNINTYTLKFQSTDFIIELRLYCDIVTKSPRTTADYMPDNRLYYDRIIVSVYRKDTQGREDYNNYTFLSIITSNKGNTEIANIGYSIVPPLASVTINNHTYNEVYPTGYSRGNLNSIYYSKSLGVLTFAEATGDIWHFETFLPSKPIHLI